MFGKLKLLFAAGLISVSLDCIAATTTEPPKNWPDVLVIDNFESGLSKWESQGSGRLESSSDTPSGKKCLLWTSEDDSIGQIVFKNLRKEEIDFSQYDLLMFRLKVDGRPIWNLNPVVQQYPAVYGFRGLYYSIDTLHPFGKWFTCTQDLSKWENAWPDSYSPTKQEFRFEVHQLAGASSTKIYLDEIRLLKNPLGLKPSYHGKWSIDSDGSQRTNFTVTLKNRKDHPLNVSLTLDREDSVTVKLFHVDIPSKTISLPPGKEQSIPVEMSIDAKTLQNVSPWYGETARLAVSVEEVPGLILYTELAAGSRPDKVEHPSILCDAGRARELQGQYAKEETRKLISPELLKLVTQGEKALAFKPEYPPLAATGRTTDPVSGGKLQRIEVPNLPFDVYQDPVSGRSYSGPLYEAGMKGWLQKHMENAATAKTLAVAYLISGRRELGQASAQILRDYISRYPELPICAYEPGSPVGSACSGATRIGGTFMRERVWLDNLAVALDCIRDGDFLGVREIEALQEKVFVPSASNMMDHKVGVMNLQMMIDSASLCAGLSAGDPGLVARALYDRHGVLRLFDTGYLPDGNWWENPSYQTVMNLCAYPVLAVCLRNGILRWESKYVDRLTVYYRLAAPDLFTPELGTGNGGNVGLYDTAAHVFASMTDDPKLAWVAYNRKPSASVGNYSDIYAMALLNGDKPKIQEEKAVSPVAKGTVDFPDYGGIAMRITGTDAYAYLHYGREVTHGHRNKLSVQVYGKGGWYMHNVMGGYNNNFKDFLEAVASSNTIMVDGRNQNSDTGELLFKKSSPGFEIARARENAAWRDVEHDRTVVLNKGPMIVIDRCISETEHVYDWLYHANWTGLSLTAPLPLETAPKVLGDTPLYSGLNSIGKFPAAGRAEWIRSDGSGVKMAFLPLGEMYQFHVKDASKPSDGLLWRQKGKNCVFAAVFWPYSKSETGDVSIEKLADGAFRVTSPEGKYTVLVNYTGGKFTAGGFQTNEPVAVFVEK